MSTPFQGWSIQDEPLLPQLLGDGRPLVLAVHEVVPVGLRLLPGDEFPEGGDVQHHAVVEVGFEVEVRRPPTFSKPVSSWGCQWTIRVGAGKIVGGSPIGLDGASSSMPTIPQRVSSAFVVLCGQYGDVTELARRREQSRQSLYREAEQVAEAVDGTATKARLGGTCSSNSPTGKAEVHALRELIEGCQRAHP